ncbi:C40 family peptidase [Streptomyces sp. NBC_00271]|uniref:C40 family peptidase n=1 Tax=Streptomyces sp. NBC_00271 TaxID=2975697 RepID=UPI002E2C33D5|nr:NlpC/P60 family protein [Streptomyces sp. NBC_00271]
MAQQTLLRPSSQAREQAPALQHCKPQARRAGASRKASGEWRWAVGLLLVTFVLSWLAGALLAVQGSSGSSSPVARPPLTLAPQAPTATAPVQAKPARPAKRPAIPVKPAKPGSAVAKPAGVKRVILRSGDTLYELAGRHGTSVKVLQRLNSLGTSTLIYAGDTFRVPAGPGSVQGAKVAPPASAAASGGESTSKSPAKSAPQRVIAFARAQLGKPYIWGGTGPRGYDCSGLVMRAWKTAGVTLPRTTWGQVRAGEATTRARLVPGDLVITYGGGHVQLYVGDGKVIHAPRPGRTVTVARLDDPSDVVSYRHITP